MKEILKRENILLNCQPKEKEEVIRQMGKILLESGYVEEEYIQAMVDKEVVFNTNIGNQVAIPHGIESARKHILNTGIGMMIFPEGTDWGEQMNVKIVIGIAGREEEHIDILEKIATVLSEPEAVEAFIHSDQEYIYRLFTKE